jgi:hypothetical protein
MTDRELMQQALNALKVMRPACFAETTLKAADTSIVALSDRLAQPEQEPDPIGDAQDRLIAEMAAQPEQEPVLWMMPDGNTADKWALQFYGGQKGKPLYKAPQPCPTCQSLARTVMMDQTGYDPRQWVGLTDDEIGVPTEPIQPNEAIMFARVIEALIKEKNT